MVESCYSLFSIYASYRSESKLFWLSFELLHCLGDVRLISRSGRDLNFSYQEISSLSYVQFKCSQLKSWIQKNASIRYCSFWDCDQLWVWWTGGCTCSELHMVLPVRQNILLSACIIIVVTREAQNPESLFSSYLIWCSSSKLHVLQWFILTARRNHLKVQSCEFLNALCIWNNA